jgi:DNA-binding PadR family transcriptional regulator
MPDVLDVLKVLRLIRENQPIHTYGLAVFLGKKPVYATTSAFRWIHYLEELGVLKLVRVDERSGRKEYMLSEKGERLYSVLEEVWGGRPFKVSEIYEIRRRNVQKK